ncbi:MAG: TetR/AcrR family transcriptional regulator [Deltaproteobacteria bacterium]
METPAPKRRPKKETGRAFPPGRIRITEALTSLLTKKDFGSITTAEIAETAGVTEALIYKYFKDKRDLLYQVLREYLEHYEPRIKTDLRGIKGSLNKLRKLMWSHLNVYAEDRVFAKRAFPTITPVNLIFWCSGSAGSSWTLLRKALKMGKYGTT